MIYTVTFNPALDHVIWVENLEPGMTNRSASEQILPGGKGLNVSTILNNLGVENIALGFIAGFTGVEIRRGFEAMGGKCDFIELKAGISRINVKLRSIQETEINAAGPAIDGESLSKFMAKLDALKDGDILILAGSIPTSLPDSLYGDIMKMFSDRQVMIVVDAEKDLLLNVLPYKPFLIKPNAQELGEIFGVTFRSREEVIPYARKLQEMGAANVLVSMAGEGAVLVTETGETLASGVPKGKAINSVGAGDSMVAGFVAGWCEKRDHAHAFKMGLAAGSASAFSERLATRQEIERVYESLKIF
ncbi:MAG: 1-phosphofructokinase [Lachnospiraceae bacterium]|nr:1-phosphofructokinase [Butyrivibrio sp.]MCM1344529.1 1-phosphofructokinase [Muribaculaceae bacterium]MCM1409359.1 1-phosphofructokinase [Lachnospiraceae bacterium]